MPVNEGRCRAREGMRADREGEREKRESVLPPGLLIDGKQIAAKNPLDLFLLFTDDSIQFFFYFQKRTDSN